MLVHGVWVAGGGGCGGRGGGGGGGGGTGTYRCSKCGQLKKNHVCTAVATGDARPKSDDKRRPERVGWTKAEDAIITHSVQELGHRWYQIAERLPGRTDHAIRNRWHRLLTMRQEAEARAQASGRGAAPSSAPIPMPVVDVMAEMIEKVIIERMTEIIERMTEILGSMAVGVSVFIPRWT